MYWKGITSFLYKKGWLIPAFFLFLTSCATNSSNEVINKTAYNQNFSIEKVVVKDLTNNPMGLIDIQNRMQISIENEITSRQFNKQDNLQYSLIVNIRQYEEGSAFLRWVIPGMGETFLNIETILLDENNNPVSQLRTSRTIQGGGGYTAGAWKRVFDSVAKRLISDILTAK